MLPPECPRCGYATTGDLGFMPSLKSGGFVRSFRCNHCSHVFSIPAENPTITREPIPEGLERIKGDESGMVKCLKCGNYALKKGEHRIDMVTHSDERVYRCPGCRYTWIRTIRLAY